jgi:hypothetical protein
MAKTHAFRFDPIGVFASSPSLGKRAGVSADRALLADRATHPSRAPSELQQQAELDVVRTPPHPRQSHDLSRGQR